MRLPSFITFTGIDAVAGAKPLEIERLTSTYPIEWGVLVSPKRTGEDPRYPSWGFIDWLLDKYAPRRAGRANIAFHLCGDYARAALNAEPLPDFLEDMLKLVRRVQINVGEDMPLVPRIAMAQRFAEQHGVRAILQNREDRYFNDLYGVDWLFDPSGGRGRKPERWPLGDGRLVGYAGGIDAGNVMDVIRSVNGIVGKAPGPYWLDMESGVRTSDTFDLAKVESVCLAVYGEGR
jgi:hypothetical protein